MTKESFLSMNDAQAQKTLNDMTPATLTGLYNLLTGEHVGRFPDRAIAVRRIWTERVKQRKLHIALPFEGPTARPNNSTASASMASAVKGTPPPLNKLTRKQNDDDVVITLKSTLNPKKAGTQAFDRFEKYVDGMTVSEALAAGVRREDIRWDSSHGHITLSKKK